MNPATMAMMAGKATDMLIGKQLGAAAPPPGLGGSPAGLLGSGSMAPQAPQMAPQMPQMGGSLLGTPEPPMGGMAQQAPSMGDPAAAMSGMAQENNFGGGMPQESQQGGGGGFFSNIDQALQSPSQMMGMGLLAKMNPALGVAGLGLTGLGGFSGLKEKLGGLLG